MLSTDLVLVNCVLIEKLATGECLLFHIEYNGFLGIFRPANELCLISQRKYHQDRVSAQWFSWLSAVLLITCK